MSAVRGVSVASVGRWALMVPGLGAAGYGLVLLWRQGLTEVPGVLGWLAGAVLVHDGLIVPVTLAVGAWLVRVLDPRWRAPVGSALLVLGTLTLMALPVLGRFGARSDNPTLLDRHYLLGWLVLTTVIGAGAVAGAWLRPGRRGSGLWHAPGQDDGAEGGAGGAHPRG